MNERELRCDFCSVILGDSAWDFPADDFEYDDPRVGPEAPEPIDGSVGAWIACDDCAALITAGKRGAVARRAADNMRDTAPEWVASGGGYIAVLLSVRELHDGFWRARRGPGVRIGADQLALIRSDPALLREWRSAAR